MANISIQAQLSTEQLLEVIGKLDASSLDAVMQKTLQLQAANGAQNRYQRESELLEIVFRKKSPAFRRRFDRLNAKRKATKLSSDEHQELLQMVEEARAFDVQYVEALTELASLRKVPLDTLMSQLGIDAAHNG